MKLVETALNNSKGETMIIKVRTIPCNVFLLTDDDAKEACEVAGEPVYNFCFTTESLGHDGFIWTTSEDFEESYADAFGDWDKRKVESN